MKPEAHFLMDSAIDLGEGKYEIPSIAFVAACNMTKERLPQETLPPD